jgi:hypothetical protein
MDKRKKKLHCHFKWKKPFVNDISVKLSFNDKLCIKLRNIEYKCMKVSEWLDVNPLAVLVDNVLQKGPSLRADVYQMFKSKISTSEILEARLKYLHLIGMDSHKQKHD